MVKRVERERERDKKGDTHTHHTTAHHTSQYTCTHAAKKIIVVLGVYAQNFGQREKKEDDIIILTIR